MRKERIRWRERGWKTRCRCDKLAGPMMEEQTREGSRIGVLEWICRGLALFPADSAAPL